jgi:hypothetical protein
VSDPYAAAVVHSLRASRAFDRGEYAVAVDESLLATEDKELARYFLDDAMRAALWSRDLARARDVAGRLDADRSTGIAIEASRLAARAGIAALEGRLDEASAGFREAMSRHRSIGADFLVASVALDFVHLLGGGYPATREAGAEARPIFERVKARPYLERLEAALVQPAAGATLAGPSEARAVSTTSG